MTNQPHRRSGIQWNAGGWFGGAVGSTAWMLVCAAFLFVHGQTNAAAINVACFTIANAVAVALWLNRRKVSAFSALLILLTTLSVVIPAAWLATGQFASTSALESMNWPSSTIVTAAVFLATPIGALFFILRQHALRKRETQAHAE